MEVKVGDVKKNNGLLFQVPGKISTKDLFAQAEVNSEELLREVSN